MIGFFGDHFLYIPVIGALIFMAVMIGVSIEEAVKGRRQR